MDEKTPRDIIDFWREAGPGRWYAQDRDFDAELRWAFFATYLAAARGELDDWRGSAGGALALMLILDQFPRNIFRGLARAYDTDPRAREIASGAIDRSFDHAFENPLRSFFYLPFMHSEALADQELCVRLCEASADVSTFESAKTHRDIIARFGRFPHRNVLLGRQMTVEERAFLDAGGFAG